MRPGLLDVDWEGVGLPATATMEDGFETYLRAPSRRREGFFSRNPAFRGGEPFGSEKANRGFTCNAFRNKDIDAFTKEQTTETQGG